MITTSPEIRPDDIAARQCFRGRLEFAGHDLAKLARGLQLPEGADLALLQDGEVTKGADDVEKGADAFAVDDNRLIVRDAAVRGEVVGEHLQARAHAE